VGEVYNGLNRDIAFVNVEANLFSASNELLGVADGYTCLDSIGRRSDSPFDALKLSLPAAVVAQIDHVTVKVVASGDFAYVELPDPDFDPPVEDMEVTQKTLIPDKDGAYHVTGEVVNNSSNIYDSVTACFAYYDSAGTVIRVDYPPTEPSYLEQGESATFDSVVDGGGAEIVSQRVWFQAYYVPDF
jgi:hypothetical protein